MQIGNRFRCYPTPAQAQTLLAWIGRQRFVYNAKVGEDQYFRRFARKSLTHTAEFAPIDQQYSHFKTKLTPWLSEVPSQVLRNGAVLWKQAYGRYFSKLSGRPAIHRKSGEQSVWITSELFAFSPVVDKATGEITSYNLHIGTRKFGLAQERHKKRWQRRQARRVKGSKNWVKAKHKVARYQSYGTDVRRDVAHKTSFNLAVDPRYQLFVFEALKVGNMTKRAKPKQDGHGRCIKNGAAAKSGLNKAILASTWGKTKEFLSYKARRSGKLVIEVPAFYSSQECAACGHTHSDNRPSQAAFVCQRCHHTNNADHNAAAVIAKRGVRLVLSGACVKKKSKKCGILKNKVGEVISEPMASVPSTLGETEVSRLGGNTSALWSLTQETPSTTLGV